MISFLSWYSRRVCPPPTVHWHIIIHHFRTFVKAVTEFYHMQHKSGENFVKCDDHGLDGLSGSWSPVFFCIYFFSILQFLVPGCCLLRKQAAGSSSVYLASCILPLASIMCQNGEKTVSQHGLFRNMPLVIVYIHKKRRDFLTFCRICCMINYV